MGKELLFRFLMGGTLVFVFALLGDFFKPKSFAGLFGAAPSIALATLGLTIGREYAAIEARSMMAGACGLLSFMLIERHELEKKRRAGMTGEKRSRDVAGVDAAGTALGSTGLVGFAFFVYKTL